MASFRIMSYPYQLYETLRNYYAVNAAGEMSILFKYMSCFVQPLILPFNLYDIERRNAWLVAQCAWQIGQLTNVLNYLYDPILQRIYISQSQNLQPTAPEFGYATPQKAPVFEGNSIVQAPVFGQSAEYGNVIFYVPNALSSMLSQIKATIAQVALAGINYTVQLY